MHSSEFQCEKDGFGSIPAIRFLQKSASHFTLAIKIKGIVALSSYVVRMGEEAVQYAFH